MLVADRQARRGLMAPWAIGMNAKEYRAAMGAKPVVGLFSVGVEEAYRWKDSVQSADEIRLWVADLLANGMRPWFTKFAGTLHDRRWLQPVEEIFTWCHGAERYLRNERPLARVGLVYSQQTAWFSGGDRVRERVEEPTLGWYQALVESRIPFEMVHDRLLDEAHLAPLKTLILPNVEALSDRQCAELAAFVGRGGGLVATSETSLRDEWGVARSDFGLAELFGVSFVRRREGPVRNAYLRLEHETAGGAPPASRARGRAADHPRRLAARGEGDTALPEPARHADPVLSRPADGEGLRASRPGRTSRRSSSARWAPGAWPTSPGTPTAPSGRCSRSTT